MDLKNQIKNYRIKNRNSLSHMNHSRKILRKDHNNAQIQKMNPFIYTKKI